MTYDHEWPEHGIHLRWFRTSEFDEPERMDRDFLQKLDQLRHSSGIALYVTSDVRTPEQNEAIGGFHDSPHLRGTAVDVQPRPNTIHNKMQVIRTALNLWGEGEWSDLGLGIYDEHLHVDADVELPRPRLWIGASK